ncbi:hypothetical protein DFH11DRAFT_911278 [Phellopilus nigrolimitatus]|nr:hypothetical protein DFH11DRAFT_911278 [Phellopilus nigrolimitatus]
MPRLPTIAIRPRQSIEGQVYASSSFKDSENTSHNEISGLSRKVTRASKSHARKKPDGHIPRPRNAFIIFRSEFVKNGRVPLTIETHHQNISRIAGTVWKGMSEDEKRPWFARAGEEKERHARLHPGYEYHPTDPIATSRRRRVKKGRGENELREASRRCAEVAGLLVEGRSGEELEQAVNELDKRVVIPEKRRVVVPMATDEYSDVEPRLDEWATGEAPTLLSNPLYGMGVDMHKLDNLLSRPLGLRAPQESDYVRPPTHAPAPPAVERQEPIIPSKSTHLSSLFASKVSPLPFGAARPKLPIPERPQFASAFQNALPSKVRSYGAPPAFCPVEPRHDDGGRWSLRGPARPGLISRSHNDSGGDSDYDSD